MLPSPAVLEQRDAEAGLSWERRDRFGDRYARTLADVAPPLPGRLAAGPRARASTSASGGSGPTISPTARPASARGSIDVVQTVLRPGLKRGMTDASQGRVGWRVLLGYGALALPLAALNLPLYVYLPTFYSAELGLDLAARGWVVLLLARLFDTVIDPLMGELSDRLATPLGHRRPWLILATPLLLYASWKLFMPGCDRGRSTC